MGGRRRKGRKQVSPQPAAQLLDINPQYIQRVEEALKAKDIGKLRSLAIETGFLTPELRSAAWPLLAGVDPGAVTDAQYVLLSTTRHRDSEVVRVDVERSLWAFTPNWSDEARSHARQQLMRVLHAAINYHHLPSTLPGQLSTPPEAAAAAQGRKAAAAGRVSDEAATASTSAAAAQAEDATVANTTTAAAAGGGVTGGGDGPGVAVGNGVAARAGTPKHRRRKKTKGKVTPSSAGKGSSPGASEAAGSSRSSATGASEDGGRLQGVAQQHPAGSKQQQSQQQQQQQQQVTSQPEQSGPQQQQEAGKEEDHHHQQEKAGNEQQQQRDPLLPPSPPAELFSAAQQQVFYYQGLHDVASVLLLTCGERPTVALLSALLVGHLRDASRQSLDPVMEVLGLMGAIVEAADPPLACFMKDMGLMPWYALSWFISWFAHDMNDLQQVARLFDVFIAHHPLLPLYVGAVAMRSQRSRLLEAEDMPALHTLLVNLDVTKALTVDQLIKQAMQLYKTAPPSYLIMSGVLLLQQCITPRAQLRGGAWRYPHPRTLRPGQWTAARLAAFVEALMQLPPIGKPQARRSLALMSLTGVVSLSVLVLLYTSQLARLGGLAGMGGPHG